MNDKKKAEAQTEGSKPRKISDDELEQVFGGSKSLSDAPRVPENPIDDSLKNNV